MLRGKQEAESRFSALDKDEILERNVHLRPGFELGLGLGLRI